MPPFRGANYFTLTVSFISRNVKMILAYSVGASNIMGTLREQMLVDLQLSGAKPRTQKTYLREVANLAKYLNRSPAELGESELKEYMLHLLVECTEGIVYLDITKAGNFETTAQRFSSTTSKQQDKDEDISSFDEDEADCSRASR